MTTEILDTDTLSLDEIRKLAEAEAATASTVVDPPVAVVVDPPAVIDPVVVDPPADITVSRSFDLEDGAGKQVYKGTGKTREEALEDLSNHLAEAQQSATRRIKELKAASVKQPEAVTPEEESVYSQELLSKPTATIEKILKSKGIDLNEIKEVTAAIKKDRAFKERKTVADQFTASTPDYFDNDRNGKRVNKWCELHNDFSLEGFKKAYQDLNESGLLEVKGEEASVEQKKAEAEAQRIAAAAEAASSQRTKRASGLSTQRRSAVPPPAEPTEDEMYNMPLDELRKRANLQLASA